MNTVKIAIVAALAVAMPLIGCAADAPEETPSVSTEQDVDPARLPGAIVGSSGTIQQVNPGTYPPPGTPPISCGGVCYPDNSGTGCICPHGFGTKSGVVCPYGMRFVCFATYCSCYY